MKNKLGSDFDNRGFQFWLLDGMKIPQTSCGCPFWDIQEEINKLAPGQLADSDGSLLRRTIVETVMDSVHPKKEKENELRTYLEKKWL